MANPKILAFAGSARKDSYNKKLVQIAAAGARDAGADVTLIDLKDYPMPLFDQDTEAADGAPENVLKLKQLLIAHQGLLIASPEYNSSITPLLKNTIDWVSRPHPGEPPLAAFNGKVAALMSASPGAFGGMRGLVHVRSILSCINVLVLPTQVCIARAADAFDPDGSLKDARQLASVKDLGKALAETVQKFAV